MNIKFFLVILLMVLNVFQPFFMSNFAQAETRLEVFKAPHIKDNFCGGPKMNFKYCKCAFHGEYCDAIGMDSGSANNYVQSSYTEYVNLLKQQAFDTCKASSNAYWDNAANGCRYCIEPDYLVSGSCQNIVDLCSDDELVKYDVIKSKCYCPNYYKWNDDDLFCEEIPEVIINTEFLGNVPLQMDGKSEIQIKISVQDVETEEFKELEFELNNSTVGKLGELKVEGDLNEYIVNYKAPLVENDISEGTDFLYLFYVNDNEERKYKTIEIPLAKGEPVKIEKQGFKEKQAVVVFSSNVSELKVLVEQNGNKFPVANAKVNLENQFGESFYTDENGVAKLESSSNHDGEEIVQTEVVLEISDEILKFQKDAKEKYLNVKTGKAQVENAIVADFVNNFAKHLGAAADENEINKKISGIRSVGYALFYIDKGAGIADEASLEIGKMIDTQISGIYELIDPFSKLTDKISEKVDDYKDKVEKSETVKKIKEKLKSYTSKFTGKLTKMLAGAINTYAPDLNSDSIVDMFKEAVGLDYDKDQLLEDKIKNPADDAAKKYLAVEKKVTDYFMSEFRTDASLMLANIADQISANKFASQIDNESLEKAKNNYVSLSESYLETHEIDYNNAMTKAYADLGFETIGKAITYTTAYGKLVEGAEKIYKIAQIAYFNNKSLYSWFKIYGESMKMISNNVNRSVGLAMGMPEIYKSVADFSRVDAVLAQEMDEINEQIAEYYNVEGGEAIYGDLKELGYLLLELEPDNQELQQIVDDVEDKYEQNKQRKTELQSIAKEYNDEKGDCNLKNDVNCDGKVSLADITFGEWVVFIAMLFGGILVLLFIIKLVKHIFKKK